jgi:hypothetical protein
MDNSYQPPGGDPQDYEHTQEIRPAGPPPGPTGQAWDQPTVTSGQAWNQAASGSGQAGRGAAPSVARSRRRRGLWWAAGLAVVAVLVGGGAYSVTKLASTAAPAGPAGQAAQLNNLLNAASSPQSGSAANTFAETSSTPTPSPSATPGRCATRAAKLKADGHPVAAARVLLLCHSPLARLRLIGGIHGEFTFRNKTGTTTLAYERGVIQSVSGSNVVVKASDGTTWTWVLQSNSVVREAGKKVSSSVLADGQNVFAGGPVASGTYQARLIVVQVKSSSPSPSPSPAS